MAGIFGVGATGVTNNTQQNSINGETKRQGRSTLQKFRASVSGLFNSVINKIKQGLSKNTETPNFAGRAEGNGNQVRHAANKAFQASVNDNENVRSENYGREKVDQITAEVQELEDILRDGRPTPNQVNRAQALIVDMEEKVKQAREDLGTLAFVTIRDSEGEGFILDTLKATIAETNAALNAYNNLMDVQIRDISNPVNRQALGALSDALTDLPAAFDNLNIIELRYNAAIK